MAGRILLVAGAALLVGCASTQSETQSEPLDPNAPLGCVVIDNSDGTGPQARIFLIGINDRSRHRIGEAAMGRQQRFCTNRVPASYKIVVEQPASDYIDPATGVAGSMTGTGTYNNQAEPIESPDFFLEVGDVWVWNVRYDRLSCTPNAASGDC